MKVTATNAPRQTYTNNFNTLPDGGFAIIKKWGADNGVYNGLVVQRAGDSLVSVQRQLFCNGPKALQGPSWGNLKELSQVDYQDMILEVLQPGATITITL